MRPLILDFQVARRSDANETPFSYSPADSMNMVTIEGQSVAFIESGSHLVELMTKTKVAREDDDTRDLLELRTETRAIRERDDHQDVFLELKTKTFVAREADDNDPANH